MAFESLLNTTCTTSRYTTGSADDYGNPVKTWANHLVDEPCRLSSAKGREVNQGVQVVVADYLMFIDDVDIIERDRVVIDTITYEVLLVEQFAGVASSHHKQCLLQTVR